MKGEYLDFVQMRFSERCAMIDRGELPDAKANGDPSRRNVI
jgi:hypothetical protein